jgi:tetratricopeptide (TPR) repeat protein
MTSRAWELTPGETAHYEVIARRLLMAGKYAEAILPLLEAARLAPSDAGVLNDLGVAYMASRRIPEAITWLRRSIALEPRIGDTHYNLGLALQHMGDDEAAIVEHRQAITLSRELTAAHGQLADLLWERGVRSEAVSAYHRTYASGPGTPLGRLSRAKALSAENRDQEAEEELRQLTACDPRNSQAHVLLGRLLQETGRFDEASATFERAITIDPWQADGYHGLVSSRRFTEADRPWVARMLSRLEAGGWLGRFAPVIADHHRMMLHFAVGKALDDLGAYAEAMTHFAAANRVRRRLCPFDGDETARRTEALVARFTRDHLASHSWMGHDDATPILIVGMPRSGTTLLERIVSSHPRVRGCGELTFWSERGPTWADAEPERLAKARHKLQEGYLRVLGRGAPGVVRATDKMPFNFFWVGLVRLLFPNARIVHARRNPVDTCLSIYTTPFTALWGFTSAPSDLVTYYRLYRRLMDHWRAVIPSDRFLDLDYEDVVNAPEKTARRVMDFCGVDWDYACLHPEENRDAVRTASHWQARQPIYASSVERWRRYEPLLRELRELL